MKVGMEGDEGKQPLLSVQKVEPAVAQSVVVVEGEAAVVAVVAAAVVTGEVASVLAGAKFAVADKMVEALI